MHSHPAYVTVGFTTDNSKYTFPDGKSSEERTKAGGVTYSKVMTHAYENLSGAVSESIMVELKKPGAAAAAKFMNDAHVKFTLPDGTSQDANGKAHDATWSEAGKHLPENVGDKPM